MERSADVHSFEVSARNKVKPTSVLARVVVWVVVWVVVLSILKKRKVFLLIKQQLPEQLPTSKSEKKCEEGPPFAQSGLQSFPRVDSGRPGCPGCLELAALGALARPRWLDLAASGALSARS